MTVKNLKFGSAHGRFQPLHNGHLEYLIKAKKRCEFLYIGIVQPNIRVLSSSPKDPHRATPFNNPLTYFEREEMIVESLDDLGYKRTEFTIMPFPVDEAALLTDYLPIDIPIFTTICDFWSKYKIEMFKRIGYRPIVLFERNNNIIRGQQIRDEIRTGGDNWKKLVPNATIKIVEKFEIKARLIELHKEALILSNC